MSSCDWTMATTSCRPAPLSSRLTPRTIALKGVAEHPGVRPEGDEGDGVGAPGHEGPRAAGLGTYRSAATDRVTRSTMVGSTVATPLTR